VTNKTTVMSGRDSMITPPLLYAHVVYHTPNRTPNMIGEAEPALELNSLPRPTLSLALGAISISPDAEFGLG
jgi:hypothetical protein